MACVGDATILTSNCHAHRRALNPSCHRLQSQPILEQGRGVCGLCKLHAILDAVLLMQLGPKEHAASKTKGAHAWEPVQHGCNGRQACRAARVSGYF